MHAARDQVYAILFLTLPWLKWPGSWALVLAVLLGLEIVLTSYDFVGEDSVRRTLGGVYPGERVTHGLMGIVYGLFLANFIPVLYQWWSGPSKTYTTRLEFHSIPAILTIMGIGVFVSGVRDFAAAHALPYSYWL